MKNIVCKIKGSVRDRQCSRHYPPHLRWLTHLFPNTRCTQQCVLILPTASKRLPPSTTSRSNKQPHSSHSERAKPCHDSTIIQGCSDVNVSTEKKLRTSSVAIQERMVELDLPSPVVNQPNKQVGLAELHQIGATHTK